MKNALMIGAAVVVLVAGGVAAWIWFAGDLEPSTELTAPPLTPTTQAEAAPPTTAAATPTTSTVPPPTTAASAAVTFAIAQDASSAFFTLNEELRGNPTTVVGATDQVAAELRVDFDDPAGSQLGTVVINARTFATDQSFRDRAIRGPILDTNDFEFITFEPTSVEGLPESVDGSFAFTVVGDLTIRDVTQSVTFDVTISSATADEIVGRAETMVTREAFGLQIPNAPGVANVSDDVQLVLEFVARPTG